MNRKTCRNACPRLHNPSQHLVCITSPRKPRGGCGAGEKGGNTLEYLPGASCFISQQNDERSTIGFGTYGNFGLAVDYDDG